MDRKPISHSTTQVHRIIKFIRETRVNQGLTQGDLGGLSRTSQSAVQRFEDGTNPVYTLSTIERILNGLGYRLQIVRIVRMK